MIMERRINFFRQQTPQENASPVLFHPLGSRLAIDFEAPHSLQETHFFAISSKGSVLITRSDMFLECFDQKGGCAHATGDQETGRPLCVIAMALGTQRQGPRLIGRNTETSIFES
jgi:hypothetical protein